MLNEVKFYLQSLFTGHLIWRLGGVRIMSGWWGGGGRGLLVISMSGSSGSVCDSQATPVK